jgi:hypothetical protein
MSTKIKIEIGNVILDAELNASACAVKIRQALPLEIDMSRWGDEYYGDCGVRHPLEADARSLMRIGEIAYWPPGSALCFFFGPTPAGDNTEPRAASDVNPVGRIISDCAALKKLPTSVRVKIEARPE